MKREKQSNSKNDCLKTVVLYVHGKNGSAAEAEHYRPLFPTCDVTGFDYRAETPWDAVEEFHGAITALKKRYGRVILIANSIGAYFSMHALSETEIARACFISPIVDMEQLILDMLRWAGVSEEELQRKKTITTEFGETLSWDYLCYVRNHPIRWDVPTAILYGDKDALTSPETMTKFADTHHAQLTVMRGGEHWFHTEEQLRFLDDWITATISSADLQF